MENDIGSSSSSEVDGHVDLRDDRQWEDVEPDEEKISVISLLDEAKFSSVTLMLQYCKDKYEFDLAKIRKQLGGSVFHLCFLAISS